MYVRSGHAGSCIGGSTSEWMNSVYMWMCAHEYLVLSCCKWVESTLNVQVMLFLLCSLLQAPPQFQSKQVVIECRICSRHCESVHAAVVHALRDDKHKKRYKVWRRDRLKSPDRNFQHFQVVVLESLLSVPNPGQAEWSKTERGVNTGPLFKAHWQSNRVTGSSIHWACCWVPGAPQSKVDCLWRTQGSCSKCHAR